MRVVDGAAAAPDDELAPLSAAAARADAAAVRDLLARGEPANGRNDDVTRRWGTSARATRRRSDASPSPVLLEAGPPAQTYEAGATALHAAARRGPLALVELLIRQGALSWQPPARQDRARLRAQGIGRRPRAIVGLLDRPVIGDTRFRAAVTAIHAGNVAALGRLLDQHPDCCTSARSSPTAIRATISAIPSCSGSSPTTDADPQDAGEYRRHRPGDDRARRRAGRSRLHAGAGHEQRPGARAGRRLNSSALLMDAGATARRRRSGSPSRTGGRADPGIARSRHGDDGADRGGARPHRRAARRFSPCVPDDRQEALGLASSTGGSSRPPVPRCRRRPNRSCRCIATPCPCITAALNDDVEMMKLLVERGARLDARDTLWNGTPLGWAVHNRRPGGGVSALAATGTG